MFARAGAATHGEAASASAPKAVNVALKFIAISPLVKGAARAGLHRG